MNTPHKHGHDGGGHEHKAAPMVEEITDYEVLEIAVRELAIEHGLFTAEAEISWTVPPDLLAHSALERRSRDEMPGEQSSNGKAC